MDTFKKGFTYDDICLVPQYNNIASRTNEDLTLETWLTNKTKMKIPIVAANMDSVIGDKMADLLIKNGSYPIFHRFTTYEKQLEWAKKYGDKCYISCGLNEMDKVIKILNTTECRGVCIDVAHAHSESMKKFMLKLKKLIPDSKEIIAGNVCTPTGVHDLVNWGANAVKVGVGPGCLSGESKVLMSDGSYKQLIDIKIGDEVMNKNGNPVKVLRVINKGLKNCIKLESPRFDEPLYATPNHLFLTDENNWEEIWDFKKNSFKFKNIENLNWNLPFNRDEIFGLFDKDLNLSINFNLGFIIGSVYQNPKLQFNDFTKASKLLNILNTHFGNYFKIIEKELYVQSNKLYIIETTQTNINDFINSIPFLKTIKINKDEFIKGLKESIEEYNLNKDYINIKNEKIKNLYKWCLDSLRISYNFYKIDNKVGIEKEYKFKFTPSKKCFIDKGILFNRIVYDLEVDCDTQSFIVNDFVVHNSACTTRIVTGFGVPQFSAVYECAQIAKKLKTPIIADGGIEKSSDIAKALAAGATSVMCGGLFSNTLESPAELVLIDGKPFKKYRGQASADFQEDFYGQVKTKTVPEGEAFYKKISGSAQDVINKMTGGLRSAFTYGGAKDIKEFQEKAEFRSVNSSYVLEANIRPK